jgi:hypothetical protein
MKKRLPNRVKFLLSDDIREETHGKMTVVGLYADDKIFVAQSALPQGVVTVMNLALTCMMFGGAGSFPLKAQITGPAGQTIANITGTQDFVPGAIGTLVLRGSPVVLPQFGAYRFELTLQRKVFSYSFEVLAGPAPGLQTAAAGVPSHPTGGTQP